MKLTVLSVAYPLAPVGMDSVGGAEQVLAYLDEYLIRHEHRSIVIACEGSTLKGELVSICRPRGSLTEVARRSAQQACGIAIAEVLRHRDVDLVHMHGFDFHAYLPPPGIPVLATLHLPPEWYPPSIFRTGRPRTYLQVVSYAEQRSCPTATPVSVVENGIATERFRLNLRKQQFALALGRICPEKGFHLSLDSARRADIPMILGGELFPYEAHEHYFREEILPRLSASRIFVGPVPFRRKRRLLASARCLLVPSLAPETSSLVAMEALASGTPVIAFPNGALAEIVDDGKTGFLVSNELEMAEAILKAELIDSDACRAAARQRFSADVMAQNYMALYERVVAGGWSDGGERAHELIQTAHPTAGLSPIPAMK